MVDFPLIEVVGQVGVNFLDARMLFSCFPSFLAFKTNPDISGDLPIEDSDNSLVLSVHVISETERNEMGCISRSYDGRDTSSGIWNSYRSVPGP